MINQKSIQTLNADKSLLQSGMKIGLYIECRKCGWGRVYIIDDSLWLLQSRELSATSIEVECEKCKNVIYVGIGYIKDEKNFSYVKPNFFGRSGLQVCDQNGLQSMEEQK